MDRRGTQRGTEDSVNSSAFVNGRVGMIVAPVEPIIFQGWDTIEALALRRAGDRTALEVPLAGRSGVEKDPGFERGDGGWLGGGRSVCFDL